MTSIRARLSKVESQFCPPTKIDHVARLNAARKLCERRAAYKRDKQWDKLEEELLPQLSAQTIRGKQNLHWLKENPEATDWRQKKMKAFIFYSLGQTIDELKNCRNQKIGEPCITSQRNVRFFDDFDNWQAIIREAEGMLEGK